MVLASHLIFSAYGLRLPNDPVGSWSDFVRSWELFRYGGRATKTEDHRFDPCSPEDFARRDAIKDALMYDPVQFTGVQAACVASGFACAVNESGYRVFACAILPDHSHLVVERHKNLAEQIIGHFKARATQALVAAGLHPFSHLRKPDGRFPSVWAHRGWKTYLDNKDDISSAIEYVEQNPVKEGKREQKWSFVTKWSAR